MLSLALFASSAYALNTLAPGGALSYSISGDFKDLPACVTQIDISSEQASQDCVLKVYRQQKSVMSQGTDLNYNFFWKKDSSEFASTDQVDAKNDENLADLPCKEAGSYYLGLTVAECAACIGVGDLKVRAVAEIGTGLFKGEQYHVYVPHNLTEPFRSGHFNVDKDKYMIVHFHAENPGIAHFVVEDFCGLVSCVNSWFHSPANGTIDFTMPEAGEDKGGERDFEIMIPAKGTYALVVKVSGGTGDVKLGVKYAMNTDPADAKYGDAKCPEKKCDADDFQNCARCTAENCNWCPTTRACSGSITCAMANETAISVESQCEDIDEECKKVTDCADCVNKEGCVWCKTTALNQGSCDAGKGQLGEECANIVSGIANSKPFKAEECSSATTVFLSGVLAIAAALNLA